MTSFAFILGLLPLVIAEGAGAASRRAVGTPVFGGMIAAAVFGIFVIPMLYVVFQRMREWTARQRVPGGDLERLPGTTSTAHPQSQFLRASPKRGDPR